MSETTNTSESVDVLAVLRVAEAYCYDAGAANAARNVKEARAAVAELIEAAANYFRDYCVDEANDEFDAEATQGRWTGCSREQHEAAKALRAAITRVGGAK